MLTRHQRGSDQNEHAPISRSSAHAEDPVPRISKRLLSSRTFPRNVPVHSLPAHPTRPCPRSTHPAFRCVPPPEPTGATARAWPVLPDSYYSEHSARTPHPPDLRPDRPLCPVASHAARGAHERKHSTRLRHGRMARSTSVCATHTHPRDSTSPLSAIASAHLATLTCAPPPPPPLRRTPPLLIGRCPAVLNHMTPMKT